MAKKLIATYPILYESKQYKIGEPLPANNHDMTKAWLKAETAEWKNVDENEIDLETEDKGKESKSQAIGNIENIDTEEEKESEINEEKPENNKIQEPKSKKK